LATLAGEQAIPLLEQHFLDAARKESDKDFQRALTQAFITIGPVSLPAILQLNREAATAISGVTPEEDPLILATQPIILYFLRSREPFLIDKGLLLNGIVLVAPDLNYRHVDGINLSGVRIWGGGFCSASLRGADLRKVRFEHSGTLGSADLRDTILDDAEFPSVDLSNAEMDRAHGRKVNLEGADMEHISLEGAALTDSDLRSANIRRSNLTGSNLSGSNLSNARADKTKFVRAQLEKALFYGADLENADFSNASLAGVKFFFIEGSNGRPEDGAHVLGANFQTALNIDEKNRRYLCRFGANNVPGGCGGVAREKVQPIDRSHETRWASSCD
jgi:uncharacterized protein YjbI with pentapeptide repeats